MILSLCLIIFSLFLFSSPATAYFDSHLNSDSLISLSPDWTPPPVPVPLSPPNDSAVDTDFSLTWSQVADEISNPITYEYQTCLDALCQTIQSIEHLNQTFRQGEETGEIYWRVKAIDAVGNSSDWSQMRHLTINRIHPAAILTVSHSQWSKTLGNKNLSFDYQLTSSQPWLNPLPEFTAQIDQSIVWSLSSDLVNPNFILDHQSRVSSLQSAIIDLSDFADPPEIEFHSHPDSQAQLETQNLHHNLIVAPLNTVFTFTSPDSNVDHFEFNYQDIWEIGPQFSFITPGEYTLNFKAVDRDNNSGPITTVPVIIDNTSPTVVDSLVATASASIIHLSWFAPSDSGPIDHVLRYDLRQQSNCWSPTDFNWDTATRVDSPLPGQPGTTDEFKLNLSSGSYCFALKTADAAPNWSPLSNIVTVIK